jgi:ABC-2 type transport system ATP-binding protein
VAIHRRVAYVPGEATLWPSLTGTETLHLLGRIHGEVDGPYRDELVERYSLEPAKKVRAYSKGNRQKLSLIAALMTRADLLILDEPTSGLDPLMERVFRECVLEAKSRGQTVLLSSHILSEVEMVCDRVAILRRGRLVETGTLTELRHLAALSVEATLTGPVPDLSGVPGVSSLRVEGNRLQCQVLGSVEPVLRALADAGVAKLLSREPSLEELFLAHYGEPAPVEAAAGG